MSKSFAGDNFCDLGFFWRPVYIETEFAWYILKMPSRRYLPYFQHFCFPRHIAQLVVSTATKYPLTRFDNFLAKFVSKTDLFGKTYEEQHLWDSVCIRSSREISRRLPGAYPDTRDTRRYR